MRSFLIELAKVAGRVALEHYRSTGLDSADAKGRSDYVTHVDRRVEQVLETRIHAHHPDHLFLGEETHGTWPASVTGPCWIVDPIDGTTNYVRGIPHWAVSICFCDDAARPRHAAVYDPLKDELFLAERGAGLWLGDRRVYASGCRELERALLIEALPFRSMEPLQEVAAVVTRLQARCEDFRRGGSAALDLAYVAAGRCDAYWELGIQPWDTAAGELLVRCGGGAVSDLRGREEGLLGRRSVVAAASPQLHAQLSAELASLQHWLDHPAYAGVGPPAC